MCVESTSLQRELSPFFHTSTFCLLRKKFKVLPFAPEKTSSYLKVLRCTVWPNSMRRGAVISMRCSYLSLLAILETTLLKDRLLSLQWGASSFRLLCRLSRTTILIGRSTATDLGELQSDIRVTVYVNIIQRNCYSMRSWRISWRRCVDMSSSSHGLV